MDNNQRYNLRSSAQQQQPAPGMTTSLHSSSTTTGVAASTSAFATSSTNISSLPTTTSNIAQSQFQGLSYGGVANPQQPVFGNSQTQQQQPLQLQQQQQYAQAQAMQGREQQAMGEDGASATAPFLRDFTLVAEAVKRVQMDAVMTEMESITL